MLLIWVATQVAKKSCEHRLCECHYECKCDHDLPSTRAESSAKIGLLESLNRNFGKC